MLITGVGEEGVMEMELGTAQAEQKTKDFSEGVKDGHDDCSTKEVIRWEKFLPRVVLSVLLVEADDSTRQIIAALLRKCCYKVAAVADGLKAWETLMSKSDDIDLILTEVELPSISGFALLTLVMEHDVYKNIPVIMMSSQDSISMSLKCMLKGAADFLIKPVRRNELRNLWQHVWRRNAQKVDANSQNNSASSHSGECVAQTQNEECKEKENNSQISCTTQLMEAENANVENVQGLCRLRSKGASNPLPDGVQRHEESAKLDKDMDLLQSKVGEEAAAGNEAFTLKSLDMEDDYGGVIVLGEDKIVRPECSIANPTVGVQVHDCNGNPHSRKVVDLIGTIDEVLRTIDGNSGFDDQRNNCNLQLLELTLRNGPRESDQQLTDERQTLNRSFASAFSWYGTKPLQSISSLYPEASSEGISFVQHGFKSNEPQNSTSTTYSQSVIAGLQSPGHDPGLIPVSGVSLHDRCSGQEQATPPSMLHQDSGARWNIDQVCHRENSAFSPGATFLPKTHCFHLSGDAGCNRIMREPVHEVKNLVPREEVRCGSSSEDKSAGTDPSNHVNGSSYGSLGSGIDGNENSAMLAGNARGSSDAGTCSVPDGVRSDRLHTSQREAALTKFRLKRKDRCFEKKVRYQSRKRLAEQRPRVKGQFVRQAHTDPSVADTG